MEEMLFKMFLGGLGIGALGGIGIMCVIFLIALKIIDKADKE